METVGARLGVPEVVLREGDSGHGKPCPYHATLSRKRNSSRLCWAAATLEGDRVMYSPRRETAYERTVLLASDDPSLQQAVLGWCCANRKRLWRARPDSTELIAIGCFANIVDPRHVGAADWGTYCNFCEEVNTPLTACGREDLPQDVEEPPLDDSLLVVLTDIEDSSCRFPFRIPLKPPGRLFCLGPDRIVDILRLLDYAAAQL